MTKQKQTAAEIWMEGFAACALLINGRYDDYAIRRDRYIALTRPAEMEKK